MARLIADFLNLSYRRDVLGQRQVIPERALRDNAEYISALKAELARIQGLGLGANLAQRDFVSYQNKRAIEAALKRLGRKDG